MAINVNVNAANLSSSINNKAAIVKAVASVAGKSSITRLAQDSICQFPTMFSASIDTDDVTVIARALEKQYASVMLSVLSLHNNINLDKYDSASDYIKSFHNNKDIPTNIKAATNFLIESDMAGYEDVEGCKITATAGGANKFPLSAAQECWDILDEQINKSVLNDVYKPYSRTINALESKIEAANEAKLKAAAEAMSIGVNNSPIPSTTVKPPKSVNIITNPITDSPVDKAGASIRRSNTVMPVDAISTNRYGSDKAGSSGKTAIVKNDKLTALEPTMMDVDFTFYNKNGTQWKQSVVLGIKTMIRLLKSELMVANMAEACKTSNPIFKFIKWTKGEFKLVKDLIFNVSEIKDSATTGAKDSRKWLKALKRRKAINNITKWADNRLLPNTTIIMTTFEAHQVAEMTGVDLTDASNALNVMNKYYLLGFGVYDTETKILSMLFDGDSDFSDATISSLKGSSGKEVDLTNLKELQKIMGRM